MIIHLQSSLNEVNQAFICLVSVEVSDTSLGLIHFSAVSLSNVGLFFCVFFLYEI